MVAVVINKKNSQVIGKRWRGRGGDESEVRAKEVMHGSLWGNRGVDKAALFSHFLTPSPRIRLVRPTFLKRRRVWGETTISSMRLNPDLTLCPLKAFVARWDNKPSSPFNRSLVPRESSRAPQPLQGERGRQGSRAPGEPGARPAGAPFRRREPRQRALEGAGCHGRRGHAPGEAAEPQPRARGPGPAGWGLAVELRPGATRGPEESVCGVRVPPRAPLLPVI
uniref:Uncharacterized protein n=1 Tax=Myotis myotis TaxID=51298 RepID=A0A7J8AMY1_MYOMY|nr:hypothetical protein mMyoMyo1_008178 [Myotis myotis]